MKMEKTFETNWNELWPIINVLNEVCHGVNINNFEKEVGYKYEEIHSLLRKVNSYETKDEELKIHILLKLNDYEIMIIERSFDEVFKQIDEWEFQARIGISVQEAIKIKDKIKQLS